MRVGLGGWKPEIDVKPCCDGKPCRPLLGALLDRLPPLESPGKGGAQAQAEGSNPNPKPNQSTLTLTLALALTLTLTLAG